MNYAHFELRGREIGLFYCVGTTIELSRLAGGQIEKLTDYLSGDTADVLEHLVKILLILNKWYCRVTNDEPVTEEELLLYMDVNDVTVYIAAIQSAIEMGSKTEIKTKEIKSKNAKSTTAKK